MACRYFTSNVWAVHFLINQTAPSISCVKSNSAYTVQEA